MQQIDAEAVVRGPFEALELQVEVDRAEAMLTEAIQTPYQPHATTMLRKRANASLADGRDDEATIARVGLVWDDLDRVRPWEAGFALHEGRAPVFNWPCRLSLDGSLKSTDSLLDWILLHGCWESRDDRLRSGSCRSYRSSPGQKPEEEVVMWPRRYAEDMERAWNRVRAVRSSHLETRFGGLEYAQQGTGVPVLMCHGIWGSHAEGIGMVPTYVGDGYRSVAPSRFGYFGTALPRNATPADQAEGHLSLLDHLQIDRAVAVGYSAGSASAIQLALRHPDRLHALILIAAHLPGLPTPRRVIHPIMRAAFRWERMFWALKSVMPQTFNRLTGVPKGWAPTPAEENTIREVAESIFPIKPRHRGAAFDSLVSNPAVNTFALENIQILTLIIRAIDDPYSPGASVDSDAARRVPGARFVKIERGGHLFLGNEAEVRRETSAFIESAL